MKSNRLMDRRTCLKGIGASLALPLLDIMAWAEAGKGKAGKPMGSLWSSFGRRVRRVS